MYIFNIYIYISLSLPAFPSSRPDFGHAPFFASKLEAQKGHDGHDGHDGPVPSACGHRGIHNTVRHRR